MARSIRKIRKSLRTGHERPVTFESCAIGQFIIGPTPKQIEYVLRINKIITEKKRKNIYYKITTFFAGDPIRKTVGDFCLYSDNSHGSLCEGMRIVPRKKANYILRLNNTTLP